MLGNTLLAPEDLIAASEIAGHLPNCTLKGYIKPIISKDPTRDFLQSDSGKNLASLGKEQDVIFCSQKNLYNVVPIYKDNLLVLCS